MIAGIIAGAAAGPLTLADPEVAGHGPASAMVLGGAGPFLAGHAAFMAVIWRRASWQRLGALAVAGPLGLAAPHVTALAPGACTAVVIIAAAVPDDARNPSAARRSRGTTDPGAHARAGRPTVFLSPYSVLPLTEAT